MTVRLTFALQNMPHFMDIFAGLENQGRNTKPMMDEIATYGVNSTKQRFKAGIDPDGNKWPKSMRVQMNQGGITLVDKGHLRSSITAFANNATASWGTNKVYGPIHQFGGIIKPINTKHLKFKIPGLGFKTVDQVTIPKRPYLGINANDEAEIASIVLDHFEEGLK